MAFSHGGQQASWLAVNWLAMNWLVYLACQVKSSSRVSDGLQAKSVRWLGLSGLVDWWIGRNVDDSYQVLR